MVKQLPSSSAPIFQESTQQSNIAASSLLDDTTNAPAMTSFIASFLPWKLPKSRKTYNISNVMPNT
jgi:hypothetical protein